MYPIKFENLYYKKVWGGRDLESFRNNLPDGSIGESWDIACHLNGMGIVENGCYKGRNFVGLIKEFGHALVGNKVSIEKFPLLVKIINTREPLSVQVHPGDEYAAKYEDDYGKTEAWYVIDAKPGAVLILGTKECTKEQFEIAIKSGEVEQYLNKIEVKKGDCFLINTGLIHSIGGGIVVAEIQQNSDITYRVYDYGRPRELHLEKALNVINFNLNCEKLKGEEIVFNGYKKSLLCKNEHFGLERLIINSSLEDSSNEKNFDILTCVDGEGLIEGKKYLEKIKKGESYLIPATLGKYKIMGKLGIVKSYPIV